jgi:hypothetical protein
LKGGHALELRLHNSRATKDLDLALKDTKLFFAATEDERNEMILERLREKAASDLGDYFVFNIGEPVMDIDAAPYGGSRFPVEALMGGRLFVRFHMDVGIGDAWIEPHREVELRDWLGFAGIGTNAIPVISPEQHFAEKLHTYTMPRDGRMNSRVKDLVDLVLLIQEGALGKSALNKALKETFKRRDTHNVPKEMIAPPPEWGKPFTVLAAECGLKMTAEEAFELVRSYYAGLV